MNAGIGPNEFAIESQDEGYGVFGHRIGAVGWHAGHGNAVALGRCQVNMIVAG